MEQQNIYTPSLSFLSLKLCEEIQEQSKKKMRVNFILTLLVFSVLLKMN